MEYDFTPWATPLVAKLYQGPYPVGGVLIYGPDVDTCRVCREISMRVFYGLENVQEGKID